MNLIITSGRGPAECRLAVAEIVKRLCKDASENDLTTSVVEGKAPDKHGPGSVVVMLEGESSSSFAQGWLGSVQWIAQSTIRPGHKRKNWFVSITELPNAPATQTIKPEDIRFEAFRAGGPGGQHQNVTDSAVRATHVPSGMRVVVRDGRSQHQNKKVAVQRLGELLEIKNEMDRGTILEEAWKAHDQIERGNPVKVFRS
jgi:peptide chain release factor